MSDPFENIIKQRYEYSEFDPAEIRATAEGYEFVDLLLEDAEVEQATQELNADANIDAPAWFQSDGSSLTSRDPTMREKWADKSAEFLSSTFGMDRYDAQQLAKKFVGTEHPTDADDLMGIGILDFLGPGELFGIEEGLLQMDRGLAGDSTLDIVIGGGVVALSALASIPILGVPFKLLKKGVQSEVARDIMTTIGEKIESGVEITQQALIDAGQQAEKRLVNRMNRNTLNTAPFDAVGDVAVAGAGRVAQALKQEEIPTLVEVLETKAKEMKVKPSERTQPSGEQMFDVSPESYSAGIVPKAQIETPVPRAPVGAKLPKKERSKGVVDNMEQIADILAERARPHVGTNVQYFYHLGPLITKAKELGISAKVAKESIRDFALKYAATSPKTSTEPNLRSASLVRAKEKQGINYDEIVGPGGSGINELGFPMMINEAPPGKAPGIHKILLDALKTDGKIDFRTNPKPATFAENISGNLNGVTVDTHAIRAALHVLNEIKPGSIPRQWFNNDAAYKAYLKDPTNVSNYSGKDIADQLGGQVVDGKKQQTEYAVFSDLYRMVADRLNVLPAEAQSLSWFANGEITGLGSAPKSIVELINERIDVTAQALNKSKDVIFKAFLEGKIPLMSATGLLIGGKIMEEDNGS